MVLKESKGFEVNKVLRGYQVNGESRDLRGYQVNVESRESRDFPVNEDRLDQTPSVRFYLSSSMVKPLMG